MPRRGTRHLTLLAIVLAVVGMIASGCGVPGSSGVISDGPARRNGPGATGVLRDLPSGPSGITDPKAFVESYLTVLAGRSDITQATISDVENNYMSAGTRSAWRAGKQITLIAPVGSDEKTPYGPGGIQYQSTYAVLGIFSPADGTLSAAPNAPGTVRLTFRVASVPDDRGGQKLQFIDKVPDGMYMLDSALGTYFRAQSIYYWDNNKETLLSEVRYVPLTISQVQRETAIVNWVLAGPSDALSGAAAAISNTTLLDPLVSEVGSRIVVDLAPNHLEQADLLKLAVQLRWSLFAPEDGVPAVEVQVDRQSKIVVSDEHYNASFRQANLSYRQDNPIVFAIGNGVVRPLHGSAVSVPALDASSNAETANSNAVAAAISADLKSAAIVRRVGGQDELWVRPDPKAAFKRVLTAGQMSRPNMMALPHPMVAVIADGKLVLVNLSSQAKTPVQVTGVSKLVSLSVAPDDRRFAVVTDSGQLYTSILGWQSNVPSMLAVRRVRTVLPKVESVAWSGQNQLVVGGPVGKKHMLYKVNTDGAESLEQVDNGTHPLVQLAAYPYNPIDGSLFVSVLFEGSDGARQLERSTSTSALHWSGPGSGDAGPIKWPFFAD